MKLSPPKQITFIIALILAVLGVLALLAIPALSGVSFWLVLVGFVVLALGSLLEGLWSHRSRGQLPVHGPADRRPQFMERCRRSHGGIAYLYRA